jgi:hypothetical protein
MELLRMKIITIGDLHGLDNWKSIDPKKYDKIIFLGDYVDSFIVIDKKIVRNFSEVIAFKHKWFDKVILLIGNHEMSYMSPQYRSTGYRHAIAGDIKKLLVDHYELFKIAWQYNNYLWTHAGMHQEFYNEKILPKITDPPENLSDALQELYENGYPPIFEVGYERGGDINDIGGPLWLDEKLLVENPLKGYHQVVGHSPVNTIKHHVPFPDDPKTTVTLCDCIEWGDGKMYELEVG